MRSTISPTNSSWSIRTARRANRRWVNRIRKELVKARKKAWVDVADIKIGGDYRRAIDTALREAAAVVVVLSPRSASSRYVTYEWSFALGAGVPVVPVVVKASKLHPRLEALQHIDFTKGTPAWGRLIDALSQPKQVSPVRKAKVPMIYAEFALEHGEPVEIEESYQLWIGTKHVPDETTLVTYEILDDSYPKKERIFSVGPDKDFMDWITSYGDIFLTARGESRDGQWRTQSTLAEALRRRYGSKPPSAVRHALKVIENN